jgi:hypothetical protein
VFFGLLALLESTPPSRRGSVRNELRQKANGQQQAKVVQTTEARSSWRRKLKYLLLVAVVVSSGVSLAKLIAERSRKLKARRGRDRFLMQASVSG